MVERLRNGRSQSPYRKLGTHPIFLFPLLRGMVRSFRRCFAAKLRFVAHYASQTLKVYGFIRHNSSFGRAHQQFTAHHDPSRGILVCEVKPHSVGAKRGTILIATLWILVILAIFALGLGRSVSMRIVFASHLRDRTYSLYLAKAAIRRAVWELKNDETSEFDSLYELRKLREKEFGDKKFRYYFIDEESKINVNTASRKILDSLPEVTSEIAKSIRASRYRPFQLKEELLFVEGMDEEIYSGVKDLVTIYGEGKVNFNTASKEIFEILGLDDDLIGMILGYRAGEDGKEATEDDNVFENVSSIRADLEEYGILSNAQTIKLAELLTQGLAGVSSNYFRVVVEMEVLGRAAGKVVAVIKGDTGEIRYWREE